MAGVRSALQHAWNVFANTDQETRLRYYEGASYGVKPYGTRYRITNERSLIASIYTRLAIDVSSVDMRHVRTDDQHRYLEDIDSGLNNCLTVEANLDQAARALRQDIAMTLFDRGCAALVPVDTSLNPRATGGYDILTLRVGDVIQWYPYHVRVSLYNEARGQREEITLQKSQVAIIENPLYAVMNEPNSTLQRLLIKLNLLDAVDNQLSSGKLDLIIQLPYVVKSEARRQQAMQRRTDIEFQLKGSQYGIAYTDATEKITQLNRPAENNLMAQIEYLINLLYSQLGITKEVMDGTADEKAMLNYWSRSVEPILSAIIQEISRKFLTKTARTQLQTIMFFKDPFRLVPVDNIAEIADKFTRNEIMTSNEIRQVVGMKPHPDPKADQLVNSNMPQADTGVPPAVPAAPASTDTASADVSPEELFNQLAGVGPTNGNGSNASP
jgi:Phage portal protein